MRFTTFDSTWNAIVSLLTPRLKLYHWSAAGRASGYSGISSVDWNGIDVITSERPRFVPRRDFAAIFPYWQDYCDKKIPRYQLNFCVNTTYVLSIFHWLSLQPELSSRS